MLWSSRRAILVLAVVAVLGAASVVQDVYAQRRPPIGLVPPAPPGPVVKKDEGFDLGSISLPKNDDVTEQIQLVLDYIRKADPDYRTACETIYELLERREDVFVPVLRRTADGREITAYVSVKREANRLLATLPAKGKAIYEAKYGADAARMIKQARERNDYKEMARAVALYLHTESGPLAASWLATYMLDRGNYSGAASYFQQLIDRQGIRKVAVANLIKAAVAFHLAKKLDGKEYVFAELTRRGNEVNLRGDPLTVADFRTYVDRLGGASATQFAGDSLVYGGNASRTAPLIGGAPYLESTWRFKTFVTADTERQVRAAEKLLATPTSGRAHAILSGYHPLTVTTMKGETKRPLMVYRSYWGVHAVDIKTGKIAWRQRTNWSMDWMFESGLSTNPNKSRALNQWLASYLGAGGRPQAVFDNSVVGTLSADSRHVYAIEDLSVPPPATPVYDPRFGMPAVPNYEKDITEAINHNKLQAFELAKGGKLKWELGGFGRDAKNLGDTYFLGAPLPLGGRLYVLTEKAQELRLVCIEAESGEVISQQLLANAKDRKLAQNPFRRTQAALLAYGEGILVVPTNAGAVFGIDVLSNSLVWAYPYREKGGVEEAPPARFSAGRPGWTRMPDGTWVKLGAGLEGRWKTTAPIVVDGKVVFTAPDAKSIHCVNLRDGSPVWTRSRQDDDLYLAGVFNRKAVVVGQKRTYAINLASGDITWSIETGMPSGVGVASPLKKGERSDTIYYLPLRSATRTHEPEICAINVDKDLVHAHTRSRKKDVPGNLVFYDGRLLSQTTTEVVAYPEIEVKLRELNALVAKMPEDGARLIERGDFLLDKGDLGGAIADFRRALRTKALVAASRADGRAKLYDALTEYFQRDFDLAEKYITEYEELRKVDLGDSTGEQRVRRELEERRRRANFLCLVGKGREAQNRLTDAFRRYLELGETARRDELIQVVDEPSVKAAPDVWSQGRIASMIANAKDAKQSKAVEALIEARWRKLQATPNVPIEDLRKFVKLFGSLFGVGKQARLVLAERLMEDSDLSSLLEAEQQLSLLRGPGEKPEVAARAIEALARLYTRKGFLEDAAYYYRILGQRYGAVVISGGKTGADYLEDLTTDKRFLPYLDPPLRFTIRGKAKVNVTATEGSYSYVSQNYQFGHVGERMPFFQRNKFAAQFDTNSLRMSDASTGEERWNVSLTNISSFRALTTNYTAEPFLARYTYQSLGHLIVIQVGQMVFGIDPQNKGRVLWERNLLPPGAAMPNPSSYTYDPKDGSVMVLYTDGYMQRLGTSGPLQGAVICLLTRDAMTAIDPVTGRTLWTRTDINSRSTVFGDEQNIYVVGMGEGNAATGTRAFRAYDGVTVRVRDFTNEYQNRVRMLGRNILVAETDVKNVLRMRIYDVLTGRTPWEQKFAPGSVQLRSEDPNLAGAVEPDGTVRIVDLRSTKEVMKGKMRWGKINPKDLSSARSVYLVADATSVYIAVNGPPDPNVGAPVGWGVPMATVQPMLSPGYGLRALPVNGDVYAFDRASGKLLWVNEYGSSTMTLTHFEDMPAIVFTARYQRRMAGGGFNLQWHNAIQAVHKRTGKALLHKEDGNLQGVNFHAVQMDPRTGKFEFLSTQLKVTVQVARTDK